MHGVSDHLRRLTDNFGIWQTATDGGIDRSRGYRLEDAALGLIAYAWAGDSRRAGTCLAFLARAQIGKGFSASFDQHHQVVGKAASPEAHALAYWALAEAQAHHIEPERAAKVFEGGLAAIPLSSPYPRATAYLLLAFTAQAERGAEMAEALAERLQGQYNRARGWFEPQFKHDNAVLPLALARYQEVYGLDPHLNEITRQAIATLERTCRIGVMPAPVGGRTGHTVGTIARDVYGQRASDAGFMVLLLTAAARLWPEEDFARRAEEWMEWFYGNNIFRRPLVTTAGACQAGLDEPDAAAAGTPNMQYPAESTIMYVLADHSMQIHKKG